MKRDSGTVERCVGRPEWAGGGVGSARFTAVAVAACE